MLKGKALKQAGVRIEEIYRTNFAGVQISVLDIGKIFKAAYPVIETGGDNAAVLAAMTTVVTAIRKN